MSGTTDKLEGKTKETAGKLTGDKDLEQEGKADQAVGAAKGRLDDASEWADEKLDDVKKAVDRS